MTSPSNTIRCTACGAEHQTTTTACPNCGGMLLVTAPFMGGGLRPSGSVECVADNPTPGGSAIQYVSPGGMYSHSTHSPTGIDVTLKGPVDIGRRSDTTVADRAVDLLRANGHEVRLITHTDALGEDRRVNCDGRTLAVQVIGVPTAPGFLADASRGSATTSWSVDQAADRVTEAVAKKAAHYSASDRAGMLLTVDIRVAGQLSSPEVVRNIEARHGDLPRLHGFAGVILSGPSDSRSTQIGSLKLPPSE